MDHHHTKLKEDYEHLLKRTWQLFEYGRKREGQLETAVANAWKYFDEITESNDLEFIHERSSAMRDFMIEALDKTNNPVEFDAQKSARVSPSYPVVMWRRNYES
jgi:hypothetical protein